MTDRIAAPIVPADATQLAAAAALLRGGELVAMPTETVYGLAADARNPAAVSKIFAAKGRPADHPLIVHLPSADQLDDWARAVPPAAHTLAAAFWPGPLTLILQRAAGVADVLTGGQDTIGLRVPDHPVALALLRAFGDGLAAPSANRFGRISPTTAAHVAEELGERLALILDGGPCTVGIESTIVDLSRGGVEILRPGAISAARIAAVVGAEVPVGAAAGQGRTGDAGAAADSAASAPAPRVSGALAAHYAPRTQLRLIPAAQLVNFATTLAAAGGRVAVLAHAATAPPADGLHWFAMPAAAADYGRELYASLRAADALQADCILVEALPDDPAWEAIHDRLGRAVAGAGR
ncbi:MAG: L-threonylcarbamoyladenylate synthase [Thauera sp.]|jgi:L-threonylcarbamoyladenylate synthase|nr:L-threonylcarbamoyladenylate synthase [Thauera sp.]